MSQEMDKLDIIEQVVEQWTENYPPAQEDEMFTLKLTSYEVAQILEEFGEISAGDITRILLQKSYRLVRTGEGEIKWLIKKGTSNG